MPSSVLMRTVWAAVFGCALTAVILWTPYLAFGVRSPAGHLVLETADLCIGLLVAYLVHLRFLRSRRLQDLLLCQGMVLLVLGGLGLASLADGFASLRPGTVDVWFPLSVRVLGAVLIGGAALSGTRTLVRAPWHRWQVAAPVAVAIGALLVLWSQRAQLPRALDLAQLPTSAQHPLLSGHPLLLAGQAAAAVCFFVAAIGFTAQADRADDELLRWLGPACALGAFARIHYVLFPSLYTDWLYTGDLLRTGSYLLLLVGAGREIQLFWSAQAEVAVLEDRRRLARELHDGVVQELGYIKSESYTIPPDVPARDHVLAACDRALDEARGAVHALGSTADEPLGATLGRTAAELSRRYGVLLHCELDGGVEVTEEQRHALARITREAISNAVRHGAATDVWVRLTRVGEGWELRVEDNGLGFDPLEVSSHGYGLISMAERARALPGSFLLESAPGAGSAVKVMW